LAGGEKREELTMGLKDCKTLTEVREEIDDIDERLVRLIAQRAGYVLQAAKFKKSADDVKAAARMQEVLENVRNLAKINGLDPDFVEEIYHTIISKLTDDEMKAFDKEPQK
jgi:isochorismate pyruvate lyase